jgi:hypothetical protein
MLVRMRGEKGTLIHCWWECKLLQPLWKTIWRLLKKLKIDQPNDTTIPIVAKYPKEYESGTTKAPASPCLLQHYSQ